MTPWSVRGVALAMLACNGSSPSPHPPVSNRDPLVVVAPVDAAVDTPMRWSCVGDYCSTSAEGCMMHRADNAALLGPDEYCATKATAFCPGRPHGESDEDCQPTLEACRSAYHSRKEPCVEVR